MTAADPATAGPAGQWARYRTARAATGDALTALVTTLAADRTGAQTADETSGSSGEVGSGTAADRHRLAVLLPAALEEIEAAADLIDTLTDQAGRTGPEDHQPH